MPLRFAAALCLLVILSAVTFAADKKPAADNSAQLQAKVVYGAAAEQEQRADIELWISEAVAKKGSPLAQPQTGWIALTGESKKLQTGNGYFIDGKVTEKDSKYEVEIEGCNGLSLDQKATLKRGERKVIKLTDNAAPNNIFIALQAPVSEKAKERAEAIKANAKTFSLNLQYNGEQGKPFYRMIVSVPIVERLRTSRFERIVQIRQDEAIKIIDHLARDGFLDAAVDLRNTKSGPPTMPGYTMKVLTGDMPLYADLGWGLSMIHRLDALREVLPDNGKKDMDFLLGRLSGWRKQWEAEHPPFAAEVGREGSRVQFSAEGGTTFIDITSKFGIDKATIERESPKWPKSIIVRLHLSGLELFNVNNGEFGVDWSVSSTGDNSSRVYLRNGLEEAALDTKSPYHTPVRIVGGNGKIPLKDGYFEVPLSAQLFKRNPQEITLEWIDFYRN